MNNLMENVTYPFLSNATIVQYVKDYRDTKAPLFLKLIISNYTNLLIKKAQKNKRPWIDIGDLINSGIAGMIEAIAVGFDLNHGNKFITYISRGIDISMRDARDQQIQTIKLPKNIMVKLRKVKAIGTEEDLNDKFNRGELIQQTNFETHELHKVVTISDMCTEAADAQMDRESLQFDIFRILDSLLTEREQDVIILKFGLDGVEHRADSGISNQLNITTQELLFLYTSALDKIKSNPKSLEILKKYLI